MLNHSFEDGWTTDQTTGNQTPNEWALEWKQPGEAMWSAGAFPGEPDPVDTVLRVPECVHKLASQLPPDEQPGGPNALILDGTHCFKVFGVGFSATMRQTISGFADDSRLTFRVPVQVHAHGDGSWGACAFRIGVQGHFTQWQTFTTGLDDHEWAYLEASVVVTGTWCRVRIDFEGRAVAPVDFFIDALGLEIDEPEPEPECYGLPRVDYPRTYNVIPDDATEARAVEIFLEGWRRSRETTGGSYDDAGIGDLTEKTARLYDIPAGDRQAYLDFYAEWYPGTAVEFAGDSPEPPPPDVLWQRDPLWRDRHYGAATCGLTIGQAGCFITGVAEAQRFYGIDPNATPVTVDETATPAGYNDCLLTWTAIQDRLGMDITSNGNLDAHFDAGRVALLRVLPESPMHFVLAMRREGNDYVIRDPFYGDEVLLSARYAGVHSFRLLTKQDDPEPQGPEGVRVSLHWMPTGGDYADIAAFLQTLHPPIAKVCTTGGAGPQLAQLRQWSPNTVPVYRRVENDLPRNNPSAYAGLVARYLADLQQLPDLTDFSKPPFYLESINEAYECGATANNLSVMACDLAFIDAVENARSNGANVKAVVFNAPVGNPEVADLAPLLPLFERACETGSLLGAHCYYPSVPDQPLFYQQVGQWYQFRWQMFDDWLTAQGLFPFWYSGEGGACQATIGANDSISLNPGAGWKACGSIQRYAAELVWLEQQARVWNAAHNNRFWGWATFTNYGWGWGLFNLIGSDLAVVRDALAAL